MLISTIDNDLLQGSKEPAQSANWQINSLNHFNFRQEWGAKPIIYINWYETILIGVLRGYRLKISIGRESATVPWMNHAAIAGTSPDSLENKSFSGHFTWPNITMIDLSSTGKSSINPH